MHLNNDLNDDWRSFAFEKIKSLGKIVQIKSIESQCFKDFTDLEDLNLGGNKLTKIESNSFQHLDKLKKLFLFLNQINRIEKDAFVGLQ